MVARILDLFAEDPWRIDVYAGEREVRPPLLAAVSERMRTPAHDR